MKKVILAAVLLGIFTVSAFALRGEDAPAAVKAKFASLYPKVSKVKWEKEDANWEAGFESNDVEMSCLFDGTGNLLETESEVAVSSLPKAVIDYCAKNYAGKKIIEGAKIVDAKNVTTYEAEIKGVGDLIFDSQGGFVKNAGIEKDAEDEDDEKDEKK